MTHRTHDPIGQALAGLCENDRRIIIATAVVGLSDRAVRRLVPQATWWRPGATHPDLRWRIDAALRRLRDVDADVTIDATAYRRSPVVHALCRQAGLAPDQIQICDAPLCDEILPQGPRRAGGRPRLTCSPACRQRRYLARRARRMAS